jgi:hypothetical protein
MNTIERYNVQHKNIIENITKERGSSFPAAADSALDKYIITMIETKDKRRLLLDINDYNNILKGIAADAKKTIEKELESFCREFK